MYLVYHVYQVSCSCPDGYNAYWLTLLQDALGSDKVEVQLGAYLEGRGNDGLLDQAVQTCQEASICILLLGLTANNPTVVAQVRSEPLTRPLQPSPLLSGFRRQSGAWKRQLPWVCWAQQLHVTNRAGMAPGVQVYVDAAAAAPHLAESLQAQLRMRLAQDTAGHLSKKKKPKKQ